MKNFHFRGIVLVILAIGIIGAGCSKNIVNTPTNSITSDNTSLPTTNNTISQNDVVVTEPVVQPVPNTKPVVITTPPVVAPTTVMYNIAEVAKHNNSNDCWVIIDSKIYNVTGFIPNHPGGPDKIIWNCGKDATSIFDLKHSSDKKQYLTPFYLADLQ